MSTILIKSNSINLLVLTLITLSLIQPSIQSLSTYIVHVSKRYNPALAPHHKYISILHSLSTATSLAGPQLGPKPGLLYSYSHSATGFAARLSADQVAELRRHRAVLAVIQDRTHKPFTTRTPQFLGLGDGSGLWPNSDYASNVIIGVIDSGICPEIPSFSDVGYGHVPDTWKGECEVGPGFPAGSCNRKIIGARAFYKGYEAAHGPINETKDSKSPLDTGGHGTHTASTAAGSVVPNASLFNYAQGEARGVAYKARIAAYKVCWSSGCQETDILAAMDQAIEDGVHVISLSAGSKFPAEVYDNDNIAIGAFHATQRGVVVSCAAGNFGPRDSTAVNIAPWILTVGASTIDREFPADVVLGDGRRFKGASLYYGDALDTSVSWPLINGKEIGSRLCKEGELDPSKVAGKMVICDRGGGNGRAGKSFAIKQAGGAGMILVNTAVFGEELLADPHVIPAAMVSYIAGEEIKAYVSSAPNPTVTISFRGTVLDSSPSAPRVAAFSSRGPNNVSPEILKPDVIAPGVNILAGWTGSVGPTELDADSRKVQFSIISGTSMACPHVSGLAALLRNAHPSWSPAAIKSALMTTAYNLDNTKKSFIDLATGKQSTPFILGSGHVDPNKALDPGLVYDIDASDYLAFLCASGYNSKQIAIFLKDPAVIDCRAKNLSSPGDLNYPSFSVVFETGKTVVRYTRKVTNVGHSANAVYKLKVDAPPNVVVNVQPRRLVFSTRRPTILYKIQISSSGTVQSVNGSSSFGSIEWTDGSHSVRSPIAVRWVQRRRIPSIASI